MLFVHHKIGKISQNWNVKNLGYNNQISLSTIRRGYILHWNGKYKPWTRTGFKRYKKVWLKYVPEKFNKETINNWKWKWDLSL